jgi:hypothetical protein
MSEKHPIGEIVGWYTALQAALPDLSMDPRLCGAKTLELLSDMAEKGPFFQRTVSYLTNQGIPLYTTREAKGVGAGWHETLSGERWISIDRRIGFLDSMIVIGHEALHLTQDIRTRCSVEGEYHAWRLGFKLRAEINGPGGNAPMTPEEQTLAAMPDTPSRADLKAAQALMHKIAGPNYLIHLAPLSGKDWTTAPLAFGIKIVNTFLARGEPI